MHRDGSAHCLDRGERDLPASVAGSGVASVSYFGGGDVCRLHDDGALRCSYSVPSTVQGEQFTSVHAGSGSWGYACGLTDANRARCWKRGSLQRQRCIR